MTEKGIIRVRRIAARLNEVCDAGASLSEADQIELTNLKIIENLPSWSELRSLANKLMDLTNEPQESMS